ncbi:MAG: hypothetical protein V1678_01090 [Candidatus Aenigmatarchaeota archaeon]
MVDISVSVPTDLIVDIFKSLLGQSYVINISIGILILLTGYMFLSYRFVIRGRDNQIWKKIKQLDKLIISFFVGIAFLLIGVESLINFIFLLTITNGVQYFNSLGITSEYILFGSIVLYSALLLYPKNSKITNDVFVQIENYFKSFIRLFYLLFITMILLTAIISISKNILTGIIGLFGFIFYVWWYLKYLERGKKYQKFIEIKNKILTKLNLKNKK